MPGNRSRGRSGRIPNRMRKASKRQHMVDYRGIVSNGRSDPPRVLLNPWNQITLTSLVVGGNDTSNVCITVADLDGYLRNQIGINSTNAFQRAYRVIEAQVWHIIPNGELNNRVRARFYSLLNEATSCDVLKVLAQVEDYGTPARNATAKFIWPKTHSSNVFAGTSIEVVLRLTLEPAQQVLIHVRVMWRGTGGSTTKHLTVDGKTVLLADEVSALLNAPLIREYDIQNDKKFDILDSLSDLSIT